MVAQQIGYDHAAEGRDPDEDLKSNHDYISGYLEGLRARISWAKQDLEDFETRLLKSSEMIRTYVNP